MEHNIESGAEFLALGLLTAGMGSASSISSAAGRIGQKVLISTAGRGPIPRLAGKAVIML